MSPRMRLAPRKALFLLLALSPFLYLHLLLPPTPSPALFQDRCHIIGANPAHPPPHPLPHPHSRSLCLVHSLCLNLSNPHTHHLSHPNPNPPACSLLSAAFHPHTTISLSSNLPCQSIKQQLILCAHGPGLRNNTPSCPTTPHFQNQNSLPRPNPSAPLAIIIPDYPFPANIYHYGNVLTFVASVVRHIDTLVGTRVQDVTLWFKGKENDNNWQRGFLTAILTSLRTRRHVTLRYLDTSPTNHHTVAEGGVECFPRAVMLGFRGNVNVWPIANDSDVVTDGMGVMEEAVWVKDAVYKAAGLGTVMVERGRVRLPPLVVGYAKRMDAGDVAGGLGASVRPGGMRRAFSMEDERWFGEMLAEETGRGGVGLRVFVTKDSDTFEEQVAVLEGVGVVVGIHGANLVNAWFVRPFGGLVEVLPRGVRSQCYVAGSNGGLRYWRFEASVAEQEGDAGGEDATFCDRTTLECRLRVRQSGVVLTDQDRERLRAVVADAVAYLKQLHERNDGAVPVVFDAEKAMFVRS